MLDIENNRDEFLSAWKLLGEVLIDAYQNPEQHEVLKIDSKVEERSKFLDKIPEKGKPTKEILTEAFALIFEGYCNVLSPSYYGYISPRPLLISILGDVLAAGLNQTPGAWRAGPAATVIEKEVLHWLAEFMGYPVNSSDFPSGIITSGGTMANASALKLARDTILGRSTQIEGLFGLKAKPTIYMSVEGHFSVVKSLDFMGFGREALRLIPVDAAGCIDVENLRKTIEDDRAKGYFPLCLIAVAGTSATGAIDNMQALAHISKEFNLWFHIDAAAGGAFANLPETKAAFAGLELADSITIDPCKWLFLSFGIGCLLVKDGRALYDSFNASGPYWEELNELDTFQMGFAGTRQWRSLGLWMAFKSLGVEGYFKLLKSNLDNAIYLANLIKKDSKLELLTEPSLPICCFRVLQTLANMTVNETNQLLQRKINEKKIHYVTLLDWHGVSYLRVSINNYMNRKTHLDSLVASLVDELKILQKEEALC